MDPLITLVVVGAAALGKWLVENAGKSQEGPNRPEDRPVTRSRPTPLASEESDEEKMRRFLEALGLPKESAPPPVRKPPVVAPETPRPAPVPQPPAVSLPRPQTSKRRVAPPKAKIEPLPPESQSKGIAAPLDTGGPIITISVNEAGPSMQVTSLQDLVVARPEPEVESAVAEIGGDSLQIQNTAASPQSVLLKKLRDPESLRTAVLLREILGAPKGLQFAQSPTSF